MVEAKRHMQPTQKTSTISRGVLDMHLQGAGGRSHAANPKDISTMSSGVLDIHLQRAGGRSQETHAARLNLDNIVRYACLRHVTIH